MYSQDHNVLPRPHFHHIYATAFLSLFPHFPAQLFRYRFRIATGTNIKYNQTTKVNETTATAELLKPKN